MNVNSESSEFGEYIPPKYCFFDGKNYKENDSIDAFLVSSVPNGNLCPTEKRICKNGNFTGTYAFAQCRPTAAAPVTLGVSHSPGNKIFKLSSIGLAKSSGLCKVQFFKNNSAWVDLGAGFSCASDLSNANFALPDADNWTNNFNSTGVALRLVHGNDAAVVANVEQKLKCNGSAGSNVSTPNVDENCNNIWDDTKANPQTCKWFAPKNYGAPYSCAQTRVCGNNKTADFTSAYFFHSSHFYSDDRCTQVQFENGISEGGGSSPREGTVPTYSSPTGCLPHGTSSFYNYSSAGWTEAYCEYFYYEDPTYN